MIGLGVVFALAYLVLVLCMYLAPWGHEDDDGFHEDNDNEDRD